MVNAPDVPTAEDLASKLTGMTWGPCNGFRLGDLLFLDDSFSPDGAHEYVVVRNGREVESITFSWCTADEALRAIQCLQTMTLGADCGAVTNLLQTPAEYGRCGHCA